MTQYPNQNQFQAPPPGQLDGILGDIEDTAEINTFTKKLPVGTHICILDRFGGKRSQQALGTILEADFYIESTNNPQVQPGELRGWAWFPNQSGWGGTYEKQRFKDYCGTVDACIGLAPRGTRATGAEMANNALRGMRIQVQVSQKFNNDGTPYLNKKGKPTFEASWSPLKQTTADIAALAARMPPPRLQQAPAQHPQPQQGYQQQYQQAPVPQQAPQGMQPYPQQQFAPQGQPMQQFAPGQAPAPQPQPQPQGAPQAPGQPFPFQAAAPAQGGQPNPMASIVQGLRGGGGGMPF